jgi:tape measure domain-containing protein
VDAADFVIRLIDKATAPAKKISAAFAGIEKSLKPVTGSKAFKALDKAGDKLFEFGKGAVLVGGLIGVGVSAALTKAAIDAAMFGENTRLAFERLTGSAEMGDKAFQAVTHTVGELGLDLHATTESFRKLLAAQFSLGESTELVKMSADLSAIGIHGEEAARVLTAISQIKAKGKVQQEELLQLAEAGVSLELIMKELQKTLGKTPAELAKLQQAGKISGDVGIEAIKNAVKQKLHIHEFGEARKAFVDSNLSGMIESLKAEGDLFFLKLGESISVAAEALKPLVKETREWVENLDTSGVTEVVKSILDTLVKLVPLAREFLGGFIEGMGALAQGFKLDVDATTMMQAAEAGRQFAEAIGTILKLAKMAGEVVLWFATNPIGKILLYVGLAAIVIAKIIGVVAAFAAVWGPVAGAVATVGGWLSALVPILAYVGGILLAFVAAAPLAAAALVAGFIAAGYAIYHWWDEIKAFFTGVVTFMYDIGAAIIGGLMEGISSGVGALWEQMKQAASGAVQAFKDAIGMHSPPAEFVAIGVASSKAVGLGMKQNAPQLESASARAMGGASMTGAAASATGGGGPVQLTLQVNVDGSGKDARQVAEEVIELAETRLVLALERFANPSPAAA